jgi:23S rRNA U2552 (ribose-2'-O)-methylase RlmE/FtsJ
LQRQEAKRLGFVARSALKLQEIQDKHRVIRAGGAVLDLGCSPGAWLQVACRALGPLAGGGRVLGIDLKPVASPSSLTHCDARVSALRGDVRQLTPAALRQLHATGFAAVLSDMCPDTTGAVSTDAARSAALAHAAVALALGDDVDGDVDEGDEEGARRDEGGARERGVLLPGGALVVKLLEGPGGARQELQALCKARAIALYRGSNEARLAMCAPQALTLHRTRAAPVARSRALRACCGCAPRPRGRRAAKRSSSHLGAHEHSEGTTRRSVDDGVACACLHNTRTPSHHAAHCS